MNDQWTIATVARQFQNKPGTDVCAVTGEPVELDRPHYYVTARKESDVLHRDYEFEHFVVIDALEEFEEQVGSPN